MDPQMKCFFPPKPTSRTERYHDVTGQPKKKSTRRVIVYFLPRECCYCGCRIARDELSITNFMSMDRASYNMAIIIQQDATEYSLFKPANCSTCFGRYFTHHQELITLYLQYLALMRPLLLLLRSCPATFTTGSSTGLFNARCCRYSVMSS